MKKIILCILLCFLCSCSTQEELVVCSTITHDEKVQIDIIYSYDVKGIVTSVQKNVTVLFDEKELAETSLQEHYETLVNQNPEVEGVHYIVEMKEKANAIESITYIDVTRYDFTKDEYEIGKKEDYSSITKVLEEMNTLGYYRCK